MILKTIVVTPFQQNARVLIDDSSGEVSVIDPGGDVSRILDCIPEQIPGTEIQTKVSSIALTHSHIDHAGGVRALLERLEKRGAKRPVLYGHSAEESMRKSIGQQALFFGLSPLEFEACPEPDCYLEDGSEIILAGRKFVSLFTPGHSPGHLSFYSPEGKVHLETIGNGRQRAEEFEGPLVIAGDALFAGSIGRTDLPGGNHSQLIQSIKQKLLVLPDETLVLSGHGDMTNIHREKMSNPFLR